MVNLIETFEERTQDWEAKLAADEWFFCSLREEIVSSLRPDEAFSLLPQAVALVLREKEELVCLECAQLLLSLAQKSDTTEMPEDLSSQWNDIISHVHSFGQNGCQQTEDLCRWYRKEHPTKT